MVTARGFGRVPVKLFLASSWAHCQCECGSAQRRMMADFIGKTSGFAAERLVSVFQEPIVDPLAQH